MRRIDIVALLLQYSAIFAILSKIARRSKISSVTNSFFSARSFTFVDNWIVVVERMGGVEREKKTSRGIVDGELLREICMHVFIVPASSFLLRRRALYAPCGNVTRRSTRPMCLVESKTSLLSAGKSTFCQRNATVN